MKKTILVIGAGKGLGNHVAEKFGNQQFRVILVSRNESHLKEYEEELNKKKIEVYTQVADATNIDGFTDTIQKVISEYGVPDVLFYNVGNTSNVESKDIDAHLLLDHYKVDVAAAYQCIKLLDNEDFADKKGAILITGGGLALQPCGKYLPLSIDKAALRAMVIALSSPLEKKGIYIGTVQVTGTIDSNEYFSSKKIAEKFWELYKDRKTSEIIY